MKNFSIFLQISFFTISFTAVHIIGQGGTNQTNQTATPPSRELQFAVPMRELNEFVKAKLLSNGEYNFSGFSIDVFQAAAEYAIPSTPYRLVAYAKPDGTMNGTFDDMLKAVNNKEYDGAVGDISILYYRMQWVDFTMPYLEAETSLLVRVPSKHGGKESSTPAPKIIMVVAILLGFGIFVAVVFWVWKLCKYNYPAPSTQHLGDNDNLKRTIVGSIMYLRAVIILVLMVLLLTIASYIPPQTSSSLPTTQRLVGDIKNLDDLKRTEAKVGYRQGAFVKNILVSKGGLMEWQLVELNSDVEMLDKLQKGGEEGGVDALVAGTDSLKLFQAKYCENFTLVPSFHLPSVGYAFAFPKDQSSSLAKEFSDAIVRLTDSEEIVRIQARTIGSLEDVCVDKTVSIGSSSQDRISLWLPVASAIFVVALVIIMLLSYFGGTCIKK